jgi:pimeloyl-ACP methyl ester carboxylesterase
MNILLRITRVFTILLPYLLSLQTIAGEITRIPLHDERLCFDDLRREAAVCELPFFDSLTKAASLTKANDLGISADSVETLLLLFGSSAYIERNSQGEATAFCYDAAKSVEQSIAWKQSLLQLSGDPKQSSLSGILPVEGTWPLEVSELDRIVIVLAGYRAQHASAVSFATNLHKETLLPVCVFYYPTAMDLDTNIAALTAGLDAFEATYPNTKITMVGHSMGGIIARGAIETARADDLTRIDQLIQIFPPNHGSRLAELTEPGDAIELALRTFRSMSSEAEEVASPFSGSTSPIDIMLGLATEGFGAASRDLRPESDFIKRLNNQSRRSSVAYSIIAGNQGPVSPLVVLLDAVLMSQIDDQIADEQELLQSGIDLVRRYGTCDELIQGSGDGAVTITSTRLRGVRDHEVIDSNHFQWSDAATSGGREVLKVVVDRLQKPPTAISR